MQTYVFTYILSYFQSTVLCFSLKLIVTTTNIKLSWHKYAATCLLVDLVSCLHYY
jgi:hypothetical protein